MNNRGGICPSCGGNMFHGNACRYGAPVTNASSYEHQKYGNMLKKPDPASANSPYIYTPPPPVKAATKYPSTVGAPVPNPATSIPLKGFFDQLKAQQERKAKEAAAQQKAAQEAAKQKSEQLRAALSKMPPFKLR